MLIIVILLSIILSAVMLSKPKCPKCSGKMVDVGLHHDCIIYRCKDCGEEWI